MRPSFYCILRRRRPTLFRSGFTVCFWHFTTMWSHLVKLNNPCSQFDLIIFFISSLYLSGKSTQGSFVCSVSLSLSTPHPATPLPVSLSLPPSPHSLEPRARARGQFSSRSWGRQHSWSVPRTTSCACLICFRCPFLQPMRKIENPSLDLEKVAKRGLNFFFPSRIFNLKQFKKEALLLGAQLNLLNQSPMR